jgi:hypothetical protein
MKTNVICYTKSLQNEGDLVNKYVPFRNLLKPEINSGILGDKISDFKTKNLNYKRENPLNIEIQPSYDGSVNLILNDDFNSPKMINSRFSVLEES